ncbi:hypothetical protein BY996DRAFT_7084865 [Phakopsora pachyrhizi]|nr:hypothetical protein BY996DRAFT_7084865 [Phakopsora pachyrhizi]
MNSKRFFAFVSFAHFVSLLLQLLVATFFPSNLFHLRHSKVDLLLLGFSRGCSSLVIFQISPITSNCGFVGVRV